MKHRTCQSKNGYRDIKKKVVLQLSLLARENLAQLFFSLPETKAGHGCLPLTKNKHYLKHKEPKDV